MRDPRFTIGCVVALFVSVTVVICAQPQDQRSSPIRVLAESIPGSVPSEFAADLLIRLADSVPARKEAADWRANLYEQAFQLAGAAQMLLPVSPRPLAQAMTDPGLGDGGQPLDGLSLRVRAFNSLLELQRERAIELAGTLDVQVPALTCRERAVPNPAGAFDISRHAFGPLERQILGVRSSTQIAPALAAIEMAALPESQSHGLIVALTGTLRSLDDDDVSFTASLGQTWRAVKRIVEGAGDDPFAESLMDAFRSYLVLHLSGTRCAPLGPTQGLDRAAENRMLGDIDEVLSSTGRERLTLRERTAARLIENSPFVEFRPSTALQRLLAKVEALRVHVQSGRPVDDRRTPEWNEQLTQVYAAIAAWSPRDESSTANYLRGRWMLLALLVDVVPSGADRIRAIGDVVTFLKSNGRQVFGSVEWLSPVRLLMDRCRNSEDEWEWLLNAFIESGDPVMRLYAQIEKLEM